MEKPRSPFAKKIEVNLTRFLRINCIFNYHRGYTEIYVVPKSRETRKINKIRLNISAPRLRVYEMFR